MIPELNDDGYLPPGVHGATIDEIDHRFGAESEVRRTEMQSLRWFVTLAWKAGVRRIIVNGSFVTDKLEPNDIDCVALIESGFPTDSAAEQELLRGLPFINFELVGAEAFSQYVQRTFASDRDFTPKGMVEVIVS